ncbi:MULTISPECIES: DNA sulfur modification protein DndE [Alteromonas]|uniref:DNA sulfur modification protein DndE n=1 Tax=Alteromonas stellipolaris TaxID=233316 RepID=A0AAW7Z2F2_9ALTE|nr:MULTISPECIES: DNA sulfur modification protein DndE [Alteromonas]AMJ85183.1 DNA sulfur modification protein DndE [Alteromonas sp. Mac1]AMJ89069.1 DNA sulfur modification protein DndE [Alteromonas sp. Mac2]MDO6577619.1 DNA sulfur modification protein DndE [Alteromonas stellipolaris]
MANTIDTIRLSEKQKQQLIRLKSRTGIENWNVLCRWALCMSLAEETVPPAEDIPSDSNVEMSWKVFAGEYADVYLAVLRLAYEKQKKFMNETLFADFLKLHLNRGISFLNKRNI